MKLIFIYGLPATGKFTIGERLAKLTGYKLFHYHLAAEPLLSLFQFGSEPFVDLRETLWLAIIERAAIARMPGLIFTFVPEYSVRPQFIPNLVQVASHNKVEIITIHVTCPLDEIKRRLDTPTRRKFQKLDSKELFDALLSNGSLSSPFPMPTPELTIDTSRMTPDEAANKIYALCNSLHTLDNTEL